MKQSVNDLEILELFCSRARELEDSSMWINGRLDLSFKIKYDAGSGTTFKMNAPDLEVLKAVANTIRQFWMPGEIVSFKRVYNIVWRNLDGREQEIKNSAASAMSAYKQLTEKTSLGLKVGSKKLKGDDILDTWFNGGIFHSDPEKVARLEWLAGTPMFPFLDMEFRAILSRMASLMIGFSRFIQKEVIPNNTFE